jgi:hypothetical protein
MASSFSAQAEKLLEGAFDMHVHVFPDAYPRALDALEMARDCCNRGMGGFLLKDHLTLTADRAYLVEKVIPGVRVFGAVVLNHSVGGLNPHAVSAAMALGARQVFMPTLCAEHAIRQGKTAKGPYGCFVPPVGPPGICVLQPDGSLVPVLDAILEITKESNAILGTGHLSPEESLALVNRSKSIGLSKVVVTHASSHGINMTAAQQKKAVELGAIIEHACLPFLRGAGIPRLLSDIREVDARNCILSTDLGRKGFPAPVDGLTRLLEDLLRLGMAEREILWMIKDNPRVLLGLD